MQIWSAEIKELELLFTSIKGRFPELEKELEQLIETKDANVILLYSRRCLEIIVTDLCELELKRPRKTEPLKGIIDKLHREEKVPSHIITSMDHLNSLSTYGTHPKEFDPEQVRPILLNLATIIKWYVKYKDTQIISQTKPEETKNESKETVDTRRGINKSKKRLIFFLSGILLVVAIVIIALFVFNIIGGGKQTKEIDKSIAVLPFKSLSDDPEKQYLADGMMDAILLHLSKIEDLRVMSRTSVEQYRKTDKTTSVIGHELGVAYLLEGSFQKYGDDARLIVQLIKTGKEGHEWANEYDRNWKDIFSVQSEVAQSIANELKAIITPEEKQLIEKTPTTNLTAYDFFQRGREEHWKYNLNGDREALEKAEDLYHEALEYDSTFAQAYTGLGWVYWTKHYWETFLSEDFLDSVVILCDIALSYNDQLSEAYTIRGYYNDAIGKKEQAIKEFNKAIKFNPNDWMAYEGRGSMYENYDIVKSIENYQKAISLNHGPQLPSLLRSIGDVYLNVGFIEKGKYYYQEALKLDRDSIRYYLFLAECEDWQGNSLPLLEFYKENFSRDSSDNNNLWWLALTYNDLRQYEEALKYFKKWLERSETLSDLYLFGMHRIGLAYWQNGYKEEAKYYFNELIKYCNKVKEMGRVSMDPLRPAYDLAGTYAFLGDREKAYENLRLWAGIRVCPLWWLTYLKNDPLFDSIRDEPEFQQIIRDVEAKYQAEHERVRKWLEEQGEL